jgi:imidazolonepropionase-like amidohydrolase
MRNAALLLVVVGACAQSTGVRKSEPNDECEGHDAIAFVDVTVVPMDAERLLPDQTVLVCKDRIVAMGEHDQIKVPSGARVISGQGRFLMPGLVDMHTHLGLEEALKLYIARGVTTVRNMWGTPMHLEWRARIAKGELLGPTIYTSGPIVDGENPVHDGSYVVRTPEEAVQAVTSMKKAGYDFIKVYGGLSAQSYDQLIAAARSQGMPVIGHVPHSVSLEHAIESGQRSIEHLDGFIEALQRDDSPVKGKWDGASRRKKIDYLDESRIPRLAAQLRDAGVWSCPTRVVKDELSPPEFVRKKIDRPEARDLPPCERAIWEPGGTPSAEVQASNQRILALFDRLIVALRDAGARLLVGTDPGNPLVVPGFSVHEELAHFVRVGLTPYQALRAATHDPAEFLHAENEFGTIAVGRRADVVLVDGNPLQDIKHAGEISGVLVRGRWFAADELSKMLSSVAASFDGHRPPFADAPALTGPGHTEFTGTYQISWRDVPFGAERMRVAKTDQGQWELQAQSYDPHLAQTVTINLEAGASGLGQHLRIDSDGSSGRGHLELSRQAGQAQMRGQLLSGAEAQAQQPLADTALLGVSQMLAGKVLLATRLSTLDVGQELTIAESEVTLGSAAELHPDTWHLKRLADVTQGNATRRRYELRDGRDAKSTLTVDAQGWPVIWEGAEFGSVIRYQRLEP